MTESPRDLLLPDGTVLQYFVDDEAPAGSALLIYHHGTPAAGPIEPELLTAARDAGFVTVELVRPGYGRSTRQPGRRVADVVPGVSALADHLGHDRFVTLGWSGGGPHAIATAALLPKRCAGALCLAGVAPYAAEGLDFLDGMGDDNIDEFGAALAGAEPLEAYLTAAAAGLAHATGAQIVEELATLLPDVDRELLTADAGEQLAAEMRWSVATGIWGWLDDDLAFVAPWGFDLRDVHRPVTVWQGSADLMVPYAHGRWLCEQLPEVRAHLMEGPGHLSMIRHISPGMAELRNWLYQG